MSKAKGPLCKVCGDEASGFHYGVDSCEGCKGFFRRCITQGMTHRCSNEEKCDMTPFTRNSCQYCRLKKCFAVGMSREASRLGRRPKRIKQEQSEHSSTHSTANIAPYPQMTQFQISKLSMEELQRLLHAIQAGKAPITPGVADVLKSETTTIPGVTIKEEHATSQQRSPLPNVNIAEGSPPQVSDGQQTVVTTSLMDLSPQQSSPTAVAVTSPPEHAYVPPVSPSEMKIPRLQPKILQPSANQAVGPKSSPSNPIPSLQSPSSIQPVDSNGSNNTTGERHLLATQFSAQSSGDYESGYSSGHGGDTPNSASSISHSPIGPTTANIVPSAHPHQQQAQLRQYDRPSVESTLQHRDGLQYTHHQQKQEQTICSEGLSKGMPSASYQQQQVRFPELHMEQYSDSLKPQGYNNHHPMTNETRQMDMDHSDQNHYSLSIDNIHGQALIHPGQQQYYQENAPQLMSDLSQHIKQEQLSPSCGSESQQHALPPSPGEKNCSPPLLIQIKREPSFGGGESSAGKSLPQSPTTQEDNEGACSYSDSQPHRSLAPKNSLGSFGTLMVEAQQPTKGEKTELLESVMETIIDAHMNTCDFTIPKIQEGMLRYEAVKQEMQQKIGTMLANIDKNPSAMWSKMVDNMVPAITKTVTFSKRLPGFDELSQQDQIKLIKQGSFEVMLIRYARCLQEDGMFVPTMEFKIPRNVVKMMPMGSFFLEMLKFCDRFNPIALTDSEIALLTSTMIMSADRIGLTNRLAVYKLQGLFLQCLFQHMKKMRPDSYFEVFNRIIMMMPELREINEIHAKHLNSMKMSMPDIDMPALHEEIFNGKPD